MASDPFPDPKQDLHPLKDLGLTDCDNVIAKCGELGITTAEEFLSTYGVYRDGFQEVIGATVEQMIALFTAVKKVIPPKLYEELTTPIPLGTFPIMDKSIDLSAPDASKADSLKKRRRGSPGSSERG